MKPMQIGDVMIYSYPHNSKKRVKVETLPGGTVFPHTFGTVEVGTGNRYAFTVAFAAEHLRHEDGEEINFYPLEVWHSPPTASVAKGEHPYHVLDMNPDTPPARLVVAACTSWEAAEAARKLLQ